MELRTTALLVAAAPLGQALKFISLAHDRAAVILTPHRAFDEDIS
jgi:hypothetical protein